MKKVGVVAVAASLAVGVLCFAADPTESQVEVPLRTPLGVRRHQPFLKGSPTVYIGDPHLDRVVSLVRGLVGVPRVSERHSLFGGSEFAQAVAEEVDALLSDERFLEKAVRSAVQRAFPGLDPELADGRVKQVRKDLVLKRRFDPSPSEADITRAMLFRGARGEHPAWTFVRQSEGLGQERMGSRIRGGGLPRYIPRPLVEVYLCAPTALSPETARQAIDVVESTCMDVRAELEQRMLKLCEEHLTRAQTLTESLEEERHQIAQYREQAEKKWFFDHYFWRGRAGEKGPGMAPFLQSLAETKARKDEHDTKMAAVRAQLEYVRKHLAGEPQVLRVPADQLSPERRASLEEALKQREAELQSLETLRELGRATAADVRQAKAALHEARAQLEPQMLSTVNPAWGALKQRLVELDVDFIGLEAAGRMLEKRLVECKLTIMRAQAYDAAGDRLAEISRGLGSLKAEAASRAAYLRDPEPGVDVVGRMAYVVQFVPDTATDWFDRANKENKDRLLELLKPLDTSGP